MTQTLTLTLDTAFSPTTVALCRSGQTLGVLTNTERRADHLLPMIDRLLTETQCKKTEIDLIVVRRGLGSYTGLRVGVSVANTLGWSLGCPVVGILSNKTAPIAPEEIAQVGERRAKRRLKKTNTGRWPKIVPKYQTWQDEKHSDKLK